MNILTKIKSNPKLGMALGAVALLLIIGIAAVVKILASPNTTPAPTEEKRKKQIEEINVIPVEERPYLYLTPLADGKNVEITLTAIKKPASEGEYELEYQAGTLLQGAFGALDLSNLPFSEKILFGSCSAGGACTYHTDIKGGTLLTRFLGEEKYVLKSDWRYFDNSTKDNQVASKDAKFQLSADNLAQQRYIVVFNTPGYPDGVEGKVVSEIYSLQSSSPLAGDGELTLRANEEGQLQIAAWDGKTWEYYPGTVDGKTITAEVKLAELFLVTVPNVVSE